MNSKFLSAFSAVAIVLIAGAPLSKATVYSPSQFNTALKAKIGTKKGAAAYNAAANFYKKALGDKKNKKNAAKYANSLVKALKKPVPISLQGVSANTLVKALLLGYFKGRTFDLNDATYNKALDIFLKKLPLSQKTEFTSQMIYNSIKTKAIQNGVSQQQVFQYYTGKATTYSLPAPDVS